MEASKIAPVRVLVVVLSLCAVVRYCCAHQVSVACMVAYDEGGAPAVFRSQECPLWESIGVSQNRPTADCGFAAAVLQGRRNYQEDRIACDPAMKVPFSGNDGQKDVNVGVAAVFDGHGGAEASEFASNKFLSYFYLNVLFNIYKQAFPRKGNDEANQIKTTVESFCSSGTRSSLINGTSLYDILKEALLRTFQDIDSEFSLEALKNNYASGSTCTVALLVNGQLLIGFVGDSKALLCSNRSLASQNGKGTSVRAPHVQELTLDHHPDREDEKARIEAAGGFVTFVSTWGLPRVNGILAMTRAIGDLSLRRFGVIAEPEVIGWQTLTSDNSFLVLGSDGIFEGLTPASVCAIMHNNACNPGATTASGSSSCLAPSALANRIVNSAFENGSSDNLSVILVPLESAYASQ